MRVDAGKAARDSSWFEVAVVSSGLIMVVSEFVLEIANQKTIGKQERRAAFPTPSGSMTRFRFEGFFPRVGKSQLPARKAPLSSEQS
jgi:hypothetical protein